MRLLPILIAAPLLALALGAAAARMPAKPEDPSPATRR